MFQKDCHSIFFKAENKTNHQQELVFWSRSHCCSIKCLGICLCIFFLEQQSQLISPSTFTAVVKLNLQLSGVFWKFGKIGYNSRKLHLAFSWSIEGATHNLLSPCQPVLSKYDHLRLWSTYGFSGLAQEERLDSELITIWHIIPLITTKGIFLKCYHSVPQTLKEGEMHYLYSSHSLYSEQGLLNVICLLLHN